MDIIEYATEIRQASYESNDDKVKELETKEGAKTATIKDVEELNAKMTSMITSIITQESLLNNYKLDLIITTLVEKEIMTEEDVVTMNKSLENLLDYMQGEGEQNDK